MPIADAILEGIGFTIGGKVVDHLHSKLMKKKRKNSGTTKGEFIGVRVNSGKVQLKLPNKNPSTLAQAKKIANKLGYRINTTETTFRDLKNRQLFKIQRGSILILAEKTGQQTYSDVKTGANYRISSLDKKIFLVD